MSSGPERSAAKAAAQASIDDASASLARGAITEQAWQRQVTDALAEAYLSDDDPRWQSGFDGDEQLWREARSLILDAVPANGSLLDVGCANGYLMESLRTWARERGLTLEVFGLEINAALADAARKRFRLWADRIYTGNVADWTSPRRFTYVRTGLEYVAPGRGPALIARLLRELVEPNGRLIVGPVNEPDVAATVADFISAGVTTPNVTRSTDRNGKTRCIVWSSTG